MIKYIFILLLVFVFPAQARGDSSTFAHSFGSPVLSVIANCNTGNSLATDAEGKIVCDTDDGGAGGGSPVGSGSEFQYRVDSSNFGAITNSAFSSGRIGLGSTTPWGYLSLINDCSPRNPCFVISTTTNQVPGIIVYATTSHQVFWNGWRVGFGTTTQGNSGDILDTLFVSGTLNSTHRYIFCETPTAIAATVTGDLLGACGSFAFNEEVDGDLLIDELGQPFGQLQAGSSVAAGDAASYQVSGFAGASSSPIFEASIRLVQNTSPSIAIIGFSTSSMPMTGANIYAIATQTGRPIMGGVYFIASSSPTSNWYAVTASGMAQANQTIVNTGVPASSTGEVYQKMRIEYSTKGAMFYINGRQVAWITTTLPLGTLAPRTTIAVPNAAGTARKLEVNYVRAWALSP